MRRFNYTGRKKILREDVKIRLQGDFKDQPIIDVAIDFNGYEFSQGANVFLEPLHKTRFMRIPLGAVANSVRRNSIKLTEFEDAQDLNFRVKVVDESKGLLLGFAENVKPYDKDSQLDKNQIGILPVSSADLSFHGVLWRLSWGDQKVVLEIERELGSRDQVVRSLMYRAFILPAAMRQILAKVVFKDEWDTDLADPQDLETKWLMFARQIGAGVPSRGMTDEENEEWIDNAVRILARNIGVRQEAIETSVEGGWK